MGDLIRLKQHIFRSLVWNSFEALAYQGLLTLHQILLFSSVDHATYGAQGAFFAAAFLGLSVLNGSLDSSLIPYFKVFSSSKKTFSHLIFYYLIPQVFIFFFGTLLFGIFAAMMQWPPLLKSYLSFGWILLASIFVTSEGLKKNVRSLLHLAFQNRGTAFIEVCNITAYLALVWGQYLCGIPLSPFRLIFSFVAVSLVTNFFLLSVLFKYYTTLSDENDSSLNTFDTKKILKNRAFLYLNELSRLFFSTNFLLSASACFTGLSQTGVISFVNSLTHSVTFFIQRIFGVTGAALFAHSRNLSFENRQAAFYYLNKKCLHVFCSLFLIGFLNGHQVLQKKIGTQSLYIWSLVSLFFLAHLLENVFTVYEKLFIAEEKSDSLLLCNFLSLVGCALIVALGAHYSFIATLLCCIMLRLIAFMGLAFYAQKLWQLSFSPKFSLMELSVPAFFSVFLFILLYVKIF